MCILGVSTVECLHLVISLSWFKIGLILLLLIELRGLVVF